VPVQPWRAGDLGRETPPLRWPSRSSSSPTRNHRSPKSSGLRAGDRHRAAPGTPLRPRRLAVISEAPMIPHPRVDRRPAGRPTGLTPLRGYGG
jgi:hypothetical protein